MYTLALALLLAPDLPDLPAGSLPPDVYQTVKDLAEVLELYRRDGNWALNGADEVCWVRRSLRSTWTAPPLHDTCWLPPPVVSSAAVKFNEEFQEYLKVRQGCGGNPDFAADVFHETQRRHAVWDLARLAADPGPDLGSRRRALRALRERLGADAYRAGELPPWVPVEALHPICTR